MHQISPEDTQELITLVEHKEGSWKSREHG